VNIECTVWDAESDLNEEQFSAVLALHRENRATLGPMPDAAFRERAKHKGLLLGVQDGEIVAYLLYDTPRHHHIKLVHVCVRENARGNGVAKAMVDMAIKLHPRRSLITAACRTDYGADSFWRSLGMHATSERAGRALNGSTLTNWTKRINIEDGLDLLESASLESGLPIAVLDTNIIGDLFAPSETRRDNREETLELNSDWLQPLVNFTVSGEVDNEINQNPDTHARKHIRAATQHLTRLSTLRPGDRSLEDALIAATDPKLLKKDISLLQDVLQVADAVHAGADYFVTNDSNLILAAKGWDLDSPGIKIVRPHQLITELTPESFISDFRSNLIDGLDLEWKIVTDEEPGLESFFRVYHIETKPAEFNRRLRELLAKTRTTTVEKLVDGDGRLWALAAVEHDADTLRLPLLRAIRGERGGTIAFQLLRHFRRVAWDRGASQLEVTDLAVSPTIDGALRGDGFTEGAPRTAILGPATATADTLGLSTHAEIALAERHQWPLVFQNAGLPTYLVPIQPKWATDLLGLDDGLFPLRRRGLGLSRELVYFSGSRVVPKPLPARVLWYESGDKTIKVSRIVARSIIVDAARVRAEVATKRFARLGVLRQSEIQRAADGEGTVHVLRFQDTERLERTVSRHDAVFKKYVKGQVQSMRAVAPEFFDEVLALQSEKTRAA